MLAANEAVAKKLLFAKQPAIYRVHDRPDPDRLVDLREILESFGYELKGDLAEVPPSAFQRLLKEIEGKPEERLLHDLLLRAQRKALYSRGVPRALRARGALLLSLHLADPAIPGPDRAPPALPASGRRGGPSRRRISMP